jgi:hypothetical protein
MSNRWQDDIQEFKAMGIDTMKGKYMEQIEDEQATLQLERVAREIERQAFAAEREALQKERAAQQGVAPLAHDRALLARVAPAQLPAWDLEHSREGMQGIIMLPPILADATKAAAKRLLEAEGLQITDSADFVFGESVPPLTAAQAAKAAVLAAYPEVRLLKVGRFATSSSAAAQVTIWPWRTSNELCMVVVGL